MIPGDLIFITGTYFNEKVLLFYFLRVKDKFMIWYMLKYIWEIKNH